MFFHRSLFRQIAFASLSMALTPWAGTAAPTLSVRDLTFGDFGCSVTREGIAALPADCSQIFVQPLIGENNNEGIRISSDFFAAPFSFDNALLRYTVSSDSGIDRVGLYFNGGYLGLAISSATEYVFSGNRLLGSAQVFCGFGVGCDRMDDILLHGVYQDLTIVKDINVTSLIGFAGESVIDQTFGEAPEPSTWCLLGLGVLGIACRKRKKPECGESLHE